MEINREQKIKVVCAMSGGVDSAVSAALLKAAGFEVLGVFMKLLDGVLESETRAKENATKLGIPFFVLDLRREFKNKVIDKFIAQTKAGLTPNPCVICNKELKFGLLIEKALGMGADFVATGHYVQIKRSRDGIYHLLKGKDKGKDQSYFLWRLSQKQLRRIIFPVGCFEKSQVRRLAKKWKLPSAQTPESQEACFIGRDMDGFLDKYCGRKPGNIIGGSGTVLGRHEGLWFYTIGQRKGIKLSGGPYYVVSKDKKRNNLVVSGIKTGSVLKKINLEKISWISAAKPILPAKVKARIRYRAKEAQALLKCSDKGAELEFTRPQSAVTPGQSAVFYKGRELLGGGVISR